MQKRAVLDILVNLDGKSVPLSEALVALQDDHDAVRALLAQQKLTLIERLELLESASTNQRQLQPIRHLLEWQNLDEFTGQGKNKDKALIEWAVACADRNAKRTWFRRPRELMFPVFAALLSAGVPLKPEWDVLIPVACWPPYTEMMRRLGEALPAERRGPAFTAAMKQEFSSFIVPAALHLLELFPDKEVLTLLLEHAGRVDHLPKRTTLKKLDAIAKKSPELKAQLDVYLSKRPPALHLKIERALRPISISELTPLQQKQLVAAGKAYDGRKLPAARRLDQNEPIRDDGEQRSFYGTLLIRELSDKQGPAYTAFTYAVDSGTIFKAGGTEIVAEIIQFGLQCKDEQLLEALQPVLLKQPKKTAKKSSAKKSRK